VRTAKGAEFSITGGEKASETEENKINRYLEEIKERLSVFQDMYTHIRIVEPIEKRAHTECQKDTLFMTEKDTCYNFWNSATQCENCVSMRALLNKKSATKIEMKDDIAFLIQAYPVQLGGKEYVVEMIKEISDNEILLIDSTSNIDIRDHLKTMNAKLITDELTKVYNRRYLEERLPSDLYRANQESKPISIVMADIDHFKAVNDTYGHIAGDYVLQKFAEIVSESIRESVDFVVRYGGEEFVIVLFNCDKETSFVIVEDIRHKVEKNIYEVDDQKIHITSSFGIHVIDESSFSLKDLISKADQCLYMAKNNGRNQSIIL